MTGAVRAGAALAAVAVAACGEAPSHPFVGQRYDAQADCLEARAALDVLEGPDPGPCEGVRCWIGPDGSAIVTDGACDAPPDWREQTAEGGVCAAALAAYDRPGHGACAAD